MPSVMGLPWQGREGTKPQDRGAGKTNGGSVTYRTCIWQKTSWHPLSLVSEGGHQPYFARTLSGSFASKLVRFPAQQSPPSIHLGISSTSLSLSTIRQVIVTHFDHRVLNALLGIASPCREKFENAPRKLQGVFQLCCDILLPSSD